MHQDQDTNKMFISRRMRRKEHLHLDAFRPGALIKFVGPSLGWNDIYSSCIAKIDRVVMNGPGSWVAKFKTVQLIDREGNVSEIQAVNDEDLYAREDGSLSPMFLWTRMNTAYSTEIIRPSRVPFSIENAYDIGPRAYKEQDQKRAGQWVRFVGLIDARTYLYHGMVSQAIKGFAPEELFDHDKFISALFDQGIARKANFQRWENFRVIELHVGRAEKYLKANLGRLKSNLHARKREDFEEYDKIYERDFDEEFSPRDELGEEIEERSVFEEDSSYD